MRDAPAKDGLGATCDSTPDDLGPGPMVRVDTLAAAGHDEGASSGEQEEGVFDWLMGSEGRRLPLPISVAMSCCVGVSRRPPSSSCPPTS